MQTPAYNSNPHTMLYREGAYTTAQIEADPDAASVLEVLRPAQENLSNQVDAWFHAQTETMRAQAARDRAGRELGRAIRGVAFTLKTETNNSRNAPLYQRYFPDGFQSMASAPLWKRIRAADVLLEKLATESIEAIAAYATPLQEARDRLVSLIEAYDNAVTAERASFEMLGIARRDWVGAYRACHGLLTNLFRNDRDRVESYFRAPTKRRATVDVDIEPVASESGDGFAGSEDVSTVDSDNGEEVAA